MADALPGAAERYRLVARLLHWGMAAVIIALIAAGVVMVQDGLTQATQNALFIFHKNVGVLILVFVLVRLAYRAVYPPPPLPATMTLAQRRASAVSHGMLYTLMIAMPVLGYTRVRAGGFPVEALDAMGIPSLVPRWDALAEAAKMGHYVGGLVLMAFVTVHIAAALYHAVVLRDGVLARMGFRLAR